jgi:hypothetical protein
LAAPLLPDELYLELDFSVRSGGSATPEVPGLQVPWTTTKSEAERVSIRREFSFALRFFLCPESVPPGTIQVGGEAAGEGSLGSLVIVVPERGCGRTAARTRTMGKIARLAIKGVVAPPATSAPPGAGER